MANEARVQSSLTVNKGNLVYQSQPTSFSATVTGSRGPTPGTINVATAGTDVSFAALAALGGLCRIMNLDATNYVTYGIWNSTTLFNLGELLPGESYVLRLSRALGNGAGYTLRMKADTLACNVRVEAFDV